MHTWSYCRCPHCERPSCYRAYGSNKEDTPPCEQCGKPMNLIRHVSFVDCPGHDILMATMLNGAAVMDGALLLIAANESCPQPQVGWDGSCVHICMCVRRAGGAVCRTREEWCRRVRAAVDAMSTGVLLRVLAMSS